MKSIAWVLTGIALVLAIVAPGTASAVGVSVLGCEPDNFFTPTPAGVFVVVASSGSGGPRFGPGTNCTDALLTLLSQSFTIVNVQSWTTVAQFQRGGVVYTLIRP